MAASHPDLIKVTEIFLIPSSFLVAALGTADTNLHRAAVSLLGLIISALWWVCSSEAVTEHELVDARTPEKVPSTTRIRILGQLPIVFSVGWLLSTIVHLVYWNTPLGK